MLDVRFSVESHFFQHFEYTIPLPSVFLGFCWEVICYLYWVSCTWRLTFSFCSQDFLSFYNLNMMCLGVDLFQFTLLRVHWPSWMCGLTFFIICEKFSSITSSYSFRPFFSLLLGFPLYICWTWCFIGLRGHYHFSSFLRLYYFS